MSLGIVPQKSVDPLDHHATAILPIAKANAFRKKESAKKILVCICQKPPCFLLSKLPNKMQMLQLITTN